MSHCYFQFEEDERPLKYTASETEVSNVIKVKTLKQRKVSGGTQF